VSLRPASSPHSSQKSIAVAGAGIVGLSIACRLAELGWQVSVFDPRPAGSEASWAGAGMLAPGGEVEGASPLAELAVASRRLYRGFIDGLQQESGQTIDFQEAGGLDLAYSDVARHRLEERASIQASLGIQSRPLEPREIGIFWPRVKRESLAGGRFYPDDAVANPRDVVNALRVVALQRGIVLNEGLPITSAIVGPEGIEVHCGSTSLQFAALVVAMGAWSNLLSVTGVPPLPFAEPVKGHLIAYHQPDQTCTTIVRLDSTYLLQRANGLLIVGASVERVGFDREIDAAKSLTLEQQAASVFPHLAETTPTAVWTGFRPGAHDLQLGAWHSPFLHLAYGHYRNGILLAPVTAEKIAAGITSSLGKP
jgi:glycine oxidase